MRAGFSAEERAAAAMAPPHSIECESSILGGLLLDPASWDRMGDPLKPSDFYQFEHRLIFEAITAMVAQSRPVDAITVFEWCVEHGTADDVGGLMYLNQLAQFVPSAANIRRYTEIVRERSKSRDLLAVGRQLGVLAMDQETPIAERIDQAQAQLVNLLADGTRADEWVSAEAGMVLHLDTLQDRAEGKSNAMPTGLQDLDGFLEGGIRPGELVIVGARPSMGKTALAMTIGLNMAADYSVAMLSMEMPHAELRDRMTAMLGRVSLSAVKRPSKGAGLEWERVVDGVAMARSLNFYASDSGGLNIAQVRSKARNVKRLHGLNLLVVDYIGLMSGTDAKQARAYQLEEISRGLKTLAKELEIGVLCLAQVNRKVEERVDHTPSLSDLRDSGAIEQDADVVLFVHRPIQARPDIGPEFAHYAKVHVAKNRNGRCGVFSLFYQGDQTRFDAWHGDAPAGRASSKGRDL